MKSQLDLTLFGVGVPFGKMAQFPLSQGYALALAYQHVRLVYFLFEQRGSRAW